MSSRIDVNVFLVGGSSLILRIEESNLADAVTALEDSKGSITDVNGLTVKAAQVAAYQVVR